MRLGDRGPSSPYYPPPLTSSSGKEMEGGARSSPASSSLQDLLLQPQLGAGISLALMTVSLQPRNTLSSILHGIIRQTALPLIGKITHCSRDETCCWKASVQGQERCHLQAMLTQDMEEGPI